MSLRFFMNFVIMDKPRGESILEYLSHNPWLLAHHKGRWQDFVVDTGSFDNYITKKMVKDWGLSRKVIRDTEGLGHLYIDLTTLDGLILHQVRFTVLKTPDPILGCEFLYQQNCTLILDPEVPKLIYYQPSHATIPRHLRSRPYRVVKVNKTKISAILDTGYSCFMDIKIHHVRSLGIQLKKLEDPIVLMGVEEDFTAEYTAQATVNVNSTTKHGIIYVTPQMIDCPPIIGMKFLMGAKFKFCKSQTGKVAWDVTLPDGTFPAYNFNTD